MERRRLKSNRQDGSKTAKLEQQENNGKEEHAMGVKKKAKNNVFTINIKSAENHTWQGTLFWTQTKQKIPFRSALELIRLLDSAIGIEQEEIDQVINPDEDSARE